jgi:4-amino-4-deoxy-L-arabinose transferase-like glycosyltransferase
VSHAASPSAAALAPAGGAVRRHLGLAAIVVLALAVRLWRLDRLGWGTEYYAAGVRSMLESWHNFLFNAFDPAGFVSLDKPPVAFWIQAASARLLGFSGFSLLLPQVLEGAASILILHHLVRRRFGDLAGLLAALFLALTPISVAIDRSNNTDCCLVLVLILAGWAMSLAVERASPGWLAAALALVGVGFNVKMLAACVVLPGFAALYLYGAPTGLMRRVGHLALAGIVFAGVGLSWSVAYDLVAPGSRPYVDSTSENSMLELAIGHNGIQRFLPRILQGRRAAAAAETEPPDPAAAADQQRAAGQLAWYYHVDNPPAGPLRLMSRHLAGQVLWLLPLALVGFAAGLRQAGLRRPVQPEAASLLLWFGWALAYGIVFSSAGGIFHAYYVVTMAPPLAALAAIGVARLRLRAGRAAWLLPVALAATAAWQAYIELPYLGAGWDWRFWLFVGLIGGTLIGLLGLAGAGLLRLGEHTRGMLARGAVAIALAALLVTPAAWALSTVIGRGGTLAPSASIALLAPDDEASDLRPRNIDVIQPPPAKLLAFLGAHRQGARYLAGVPNARIAAPLIIATGQPVMAMGGFLGTDPILTPGRLAELVAQNQLRYVLLGAPDTLDRFFGAQAAQKPLTDWVKANGRPVDPADWRPAPATNEEDPLLARRRRGGDLGRSELFDLRPDQAS